MKLIYKLIIIFIIIAVIVVRTIVLPVMKPPKEKIIDSFKKNYDIFQSIADYAINTEGSFNVYSNIINIPHYDCEITDMSPKIKRNINKLIRRFIYVGIQEFGGNTIYFRRNVGGFEQGIVYLADDSLTGNIFFTEKIRDHWYYYWNIGL